jgi:hypothetical protein
MTAPYWTHSVRPRDQAVCVQQTRSEFQYPAQDILVHICQAGTSSYPDSSLAIVHTKVWTRGIRMTGSCVYDEWNILRACHLRGCFLYPDRQVFIGSVIGRGVERDEGVLCFAMTELPRDLFNG